MDLTALGLSDRLLRGMTHSGLRSPNPFQADLLRRAVEGKNVFALTPPEQEVIGAVVLPALQQCTMPAEGMGRSPRVLIVTSSRDRARALQRGALAYGRFLSLRAVALYGGVTVESQIPLLQQGAEIVIATPERLIEHIQQGSVHLATLRFLILDEADRLMEGGLSTSFAEIRKEIPESRITFLFAGRRSDELREFAAGVLGDAVEICPEAPDSEETSQTAPSAREPGKRQERPRVPQRKGSLFGNRPRPGGPSRQGGNTRQESDTGYGEAGRHRDAVGSGGPGHQSGHGRGRGFGRPGGSAGHTGLARHSGPARHTGPSGHSGPARHTGSAGHSGPARHTGASGHSGLAGHTGSQRHSGPPRHTTPSGHSGPAQGGAFKNSAKGKKKPRRGTPLNAPRKKRPPKRLDSFSSDSGGAGWS